MGDLHPLVRLSEQGRLGIYSQRVLSPLPSSSTIDSFSMTTAVTRITPCPPGFSDHIFKVDHGVELPLRIWPAPEGKKNAPWLLWFHGGRCSDFCTVNES
jgi:hypothetical protein